MKLFLLFILGLIIVIGLMIMVGLYLKYGFIDTTDESENSVFKYRRAENKDLKSMAWLVTCNIGTCDLKLEIDVHVNDEVIFQRNLNTIDVSKYYVCEKDGEIIGLCGIDKSYREDCDEILYLVVASSYRKLGIGTKLLEFCCNSTDKDVLYEAWGDGSEVNSKHILEKLGFKLIENKGDEFYKDNGYCNLCVNRNKTNCNSCKCEIWKLSHNEGIIWHNADEEPQENTKIIWYATGDCIKMCTHTKDMVHGGMTKWAYAEELLNLKTQEPIESLSRIKGWVARDKKWFDEENRLTFFFTKPERHTSILAVSEGWWNAKSDEHCCEGFRIDKNLFPELTWEDEPIKVEITIKHC